MMINKRHLSVLFLLSTGLLLGGCTGSIEDVRVKTCKQLAMNLLDVSGDVDWREPKIVIHEPEFASITVRSRGSDEITAVCLYEYDAAEETAETHADPLSAYATVPYEVTVNAHLVSAPDLYQAMNALRLKAGKRLLEQAKGWADAAKSKAEKLLE